MFLIDANVLIYAFRRDSPHHTACHAWLVQALSGPAFVATTSVVELALVRVMTLPVLGASAASVDDVLGFLVALHDQPMALRIEPQDRHPDLWRSLCRGLELRGNDVNDAFLAALALENEATLVTCDQGFRRFQALTILDPTRVE